MEENYKDEMIVIDNVNRYNEIFGLCLLYTSDAADD